MSGEHRHQDYEEAIAALNNRVTALETKPTEPGPEPEPEPEPGKYLWESDYTVSPWWKNHGVISEDNANSHSMAINVINNPLGEFTEKVLQVDCLPGTPLDTGGTCYGFTDRCSFAKMGLCESDEQGVPEFYWKGYFALPANWGDTEDDVRWRTRTGSYKLLNTFGTYDPKRGVWSQPFSNNFAALAWASSISAIVKGPPGTNNYNRDQCVPSTFFSCYQASGQRRNPLPNGQQADMIQRPWHFNPNPSDFTGIGSSAKPYVFVTRGIWHPIEVYIRVNQAGQPNGEYKAWFDGKLAMHINDLQMMPNIQRGINIWHNQYFHGGPEGNDTKQTMYLGPAAFDNERLVDF